MKALILAAGFGKRMAPVTEVIPKPLLPVGGIPAIRHNIEKLISLGVDEIVINVHHLPELIKEELGDIKKPRIVFSEEREILGTAGGIKRACDFLGEGDFLIINSDVISEMDYRGLINYHLKKGASCTMALRESKESEQYGVVEVDLEGRVRRFLGEGFSGDFKKYMYTGVQVMNPCFLKNVPRGVYCDISKEVYPEKVYAEGELFGLVTEEYWTDIGKPSPLLAANGRFLKLLSKTPSKPPGIRFVNNSAVHNSAEVANAGHGISSSFIGENVVIEGGAIVDKSIIMKGARIREGALVRGSVVGPATTLEAGVFERVVVSKVFEKLKFNRF